MAKRFFLRLVRGRWFARVLLISAAVWFFPAQSGATEPACQKKDPINALWLLAQNCRESRGCYSACRKSSPADQYVVIKDFRWTKNHAYLIIPSVQIKGIESSEIFDPPFVNLWEYGWDVSKACPGQSAPHTGLAINSACARTEQQLHIHISCVRSDVQRCLEDKDRRGEISSQPKHPSRLPLGPWCTVYEVVKVRSLSDNDSPFKVVRHFPAVNDQNMADQSIAVVGSNQPENYYVLDTYRHGKNLGSAEELLNQSCSDWQKPQPPSATSCPCK